MLVLNVLLGLNMNFMRSILSAIALLLSLSVAPVCAFVIDINDAHQNKWSGQLAERFFSKVYAELGITPSFVYYPSKRGLRMVNRGYIDAEAGRFSSVGANYPNLIKVDQAVVNLHVGLFCLGKKTCVPTENDAVVLLDGLEIGDRFCEVKRFNCRYESDVNVIIRLLEDGIASAFMSTTMSAKQIVCGSGTTQIAFSDIPEFKQYTYHYVNRKHIDLVPKLEAAIRKLRDLEPEFRKLNTIETALDYKCGKDIIITTATR